MGSPAGALVTPVFQPCVSAVWMTDPSGSNTKLLMDGDVMLELQSGVGAAEQGRRGKGRIMRVRRLNVARE
jgi:hypothetical protein